MATQISPLMITAEQQQFISSRFKLYRHEQFGYVRHHRHNGPLTVKTATENMKAMDQNHKKYTHALSPMKSVSRKRHNVKVLYLPTK